MKNEIFNNLFVLELANNHWGDLNRAKQIVLEHSKIVRNNGVKAAIKLQFRDVDSFIHRDYINQGKDQNLLNLPKRDRYIQKTSRTKLSLEEFSKLVEFIRMQGCIPMATPFDEASVDHCVSLGLPLIKVASSDINDWELLNKISQTKKPVILSSGGASEKQIDNAINFFLSRRIRVALNHCVSKYPTEDSELELNQIDYLKNRYPNLVIGLSTHEYCDWSSSMFISYAKGARTWERHIDILYPEGHEQSEVMKYCSLPHQTDEWFKSFLKARSMSGNSSNRRRIIEEKESYYLEVLQRGYYLKHGVQAGDAITTVDLYSAIPFQKEINQFTSRDFLAEVYIMKKSLPKDAPLTHNDVLLTTPNRANFV